MTRPDEAVPEAVLPDDRFCTTCGMNLRGEAVTREPHYEMLIVRCPRCGAVAGVQAHRRLGRWARRWMALITAAWLWLLILLLVGGAGAMFGLGGGTAFLASNDYGRWIDGQFRTEMARRGVTNLIISHDHSPEFVAWWGEQDPEALFRAVGGWRYGVAWRALHFWWLLGMLGVVLGMTWAVLTPGSGRRARLALLALVALAMATFSALLLAVLLGEDPPGLSYTVAAQRIAPPVLAASLGVSLIAAGVGLAIGRPVARWMARLLLAPRLRSGLAWLWVADGRRVPPMRPSRPA